MPKVFMIGHLDADCFYVSCERVRFPSLRNKPVGVLGNQGACVIAKSYEMKAMGVKTGMPIWESVQFCPQGIYVKRDFRWYEVISRQMLQMLQEISPTVEYYSIDEMFFDAGFLPQVFRAPMPQAVEALKYRMMKEIGVPVSIGVSRSKTLAKLVSDGAKPFGTGVLSDKQETEEFLETQPVEEVCGIAERSRRKLAMYRISNCREFIQANRHLIRKLLTRKGEILWWELQGTPMQPIQTQRPPHKCIGRGGSLGGTVTDWARLYAFGVRNVERLIEELDYHQVYTSRLALALAFKGGAGWCDQIDLPEATARFDLLRDATERFLRDAFQFRLPVTGMDLFATKLCYRHLVQGSLFAQPNPHAEQIAFAKRFVNERMGRFAVRSGATLPLADVYIDDTNQYDICDVRGKMCF